VCIKKENAKRRSKSERERERRREALLFSLSLFLFPDIFYAKAVYTFFHLYDDVKK